MSTAEQLAEAVAAQMAGSTPEDRLRSFHRAMKPHTGRVAGSFYALRGYVSGKRPIPPPYISAAEKVLGVTLRGDDRPSRPAAPSRSGGSAAPPPPGGKQDAPDPFEDIRDTVERAGAEPSDDALHMLDEKKAGNPISRRNWGILFRAVVGRETPAAIAQDVKLSAARVKAIADEYAGRVRSKASGGTPE